MGAPMINLGVPEAANPQEVVRRLRWAFAAAGIRFTKNMKTNHGTVRLHTKGGRGWMVLLQDIAALGWSTEAMLDDPPLQMHLKAALEAMECADGETAYFHIRRLVEVDNPTAEQQAPQKLHLAMPIGMGGWGGALFERVRRKLRITAVGTVIKGKQHE
jgi:hypothetical protein